MKVDFNNVRRQACLTYNNLVRKLNNNVRYGTVTIESLDIQEELDDLRMQLGTIAACYHETDPDIKDSSLKEGLVPFNDEGEDAP